MGHDPSKEFAPHPNLSPQAAIGFTHLQNRLKYKDLDDPRFPKHNDRSRRASIEKTRLFHRCPSLVERCVHTIVAKRGGSATEASRGGGRNRALRDAQTVKK